MRTHTGVVLMAVAVALAARAQAPEPAAAPPKELAGLPADPRPGTVLPASSAQPVWADLETVNPEAGFGTARGLDGKRVAFRLAPYVSWWRFGSPGAAPDEFRPGDRALLKLQTVRLARVAGSYAVEIRDEISEQMRTGQSYRMAALDRDNYRFSLEALAPTGEPAGERLTLEYGRRTFLVLREDPVYVFRIAEGTRLWANTGTQPGATERSAREVLDEASRKRFEGQERLRALARLDAHGAPGYLLAGAGPARVQLFPDATEWAGRLRPGDAVTIQAGAVRIDRKVAALNGVQATLDGPIPSVRAPARVTVALPERPVDYERDLRPLLEVNCWGCHREGRGDAATP